MSQSPHNAPSHEALRASIRSLRMADAGLEVDETHGPIKAIAEVLHGQHANSPANRARLVTALSRLESLPPTPRSLEAIAVVSGFFALTAPQAPQRGWDTDLMM